MKSCTNGPANSISDSTDAVLVRLYRKPVRAEPHIVLAELLDEDFTAGVGQYQPFKQLDTANRVSIGFLQVSLSLDGFVDSVQPCESYLRGGSREARLGYGEGEALFSTVDVSK